MFSRVAVLPQPPLLVPELMGMSTVDSEPVRTACLEATARLRAVARDWVVVAPGADAESYGMWLRGSFRAYGVDTAVSLAAGETDCDSTDSAVTTDLPLPVLLAGWLREQSGVNAVRVQLVRGDGDLDTSIRTAAQLSHRASEPALLVLGDGSNRRGQRAPGGNDERAEEFDARVACALAAADCRALRELDPELAAELGVTGRVPWQVLATLPTGSERWSGELLYSAAPFGVGYHVAVWDRV